MFHAGLTLKRQTQRGRLSVVRAIVNRMEVMAQEIDTIPSGNIRVPRAEFVEVWMRAEALSDGQSLQGWGAGYLAGVAMTCRWLANATVRARVGLGNRRPVRRRGASERIGGEAEAIEAEVVAAAESGAELTLELSALMGMRAAFAWAWRATAPAPVDVDPAGTRRAATG